MPEPISAILDSRGPRYDIWRKLLGSEHVPLRSSHSVKAEIGEEKDVEVYMVNLAAMNLKQRAYFLSFVASQFGVPIYEVEKEIEEKGFPIRTADVIVSISMRAVV